MTHRLNISAILAILAVALAATGIAPAQDTPAVGDPVPAQPSVDTAVADMPRVTIPMGGDHRLVITSNRLFIQPGEEQGVYYLRFCEGVRVTGEEFALSADIVELDVTNSESMDFRTMEFPTPAADPDRIVRDPGKVIAEMAQEMKVPRADLGESSVRRVGAGGRVVVNVQSIRLETEQLVSTDGGYTWSAESRSRLTAIDPETGTGAKIAADYLLYDMRDGRMLARGNIITERIGPGGLPLTAESQRYELDLEQQTLRASEGLKLFSGDYQMCCGRISADVANDRLLVTDSPHLMDHATGRSLDATEIESDLNGTRATARGDVQFRDPVTGLSLAADEVSVDIAAGVIRATGGPVVTYQGSSFTGEEIVITLNDDRSVTIEVTGPQQAHLNLDELEGLSAPAEAETVK